MSAYSIIRRHYKRNFQNEIEVYFQWLARVIVWRNGAQIAQQVKTYSIVNIPVGRLYYIAIDGEMYGIMAMNNKHANDVWYNGRFMGDNYAVFKAVHCEHCDAMFYQQISKWYSYYTCAVKCMCKIAGVEYEKGRD